jgi:hypothetical protein
LQPATIAERLIALLPRGEIPSIASRAKLLGADAAPKSLRVAKVIAINLFIMAGILCAQWALMNLKPPTDAGTTQAPAASAALSPISSSGPGL